MSFKHKMNKKDRITDLIKLRRRLFGEDDLAELRLKNEAIDAFEHKYLTSLTEEVREEVMKSKLFCLSNNVLNQSRYSNVVN